MPRIKIRKKDQINFLYNLSVGARLDWTALSKQLRVCTRTIRDWRNAKHTIPEEAFRFFLKLANNKIEIPQYKILPDFWSIKKAGKKGAAARFKKYGDLGTPEGRRRGGLVSQEKRRLYPELYANCNLRRIISEPEDSIDLAEFIGIMLGDGSIGCDTQAVISLHKENDRHYIPFVCSIIKKLFSIDPIVYYHKKSSHKNVASVTVNSTSLVSFLKSKGLKKGHKVKHQVDVPHWIKMNKIFSKHCLRGLIDTDGCVYFHRHKTNGCDCFNVGINFSNKSAPLLNFVYKTLENLNFHPKIFSNGVNLYRESEVCRYAKEIKFQNFHHDRRLKEFLNKKY